MESGDSLNNKHEPSSSRGINQSPTLQPTSLISANTTRVSSPHLTEPNSSPSAAESRSALSHSALQYKPHTLLCFTQSSDVHHPLAELQRRTSRTVPLSERRFCLDLNLYKGVKYWDVCAERPSFQPHTRAQLSVLVSSNDYSVNEVRLRILKISSLL